MQGNLYEGRLQTDISPDNNPILKEGDIYEISEFLVVINTQDFLFFLSILLILSG